MCADQSLIERACDLKLRTSFTLITCLVGTAACKDKTTTTPATPTPPSPVPSVTYYWKATWGDFFRLIVQDGGIGAATGNGGRTIYDYGRTLTIPGIYNPTPHYAYLGVNNSGSETGS